MKPALHAKPATKKRVLPPPRVRFEPPTIEEAVSAARDLASDLEAQVEIAAGLIGLSQDEVRPYAARAADPRVVPSSRSIGHRVVIVERKGARSRMAMR